VNEVTARVFLTPNPSPAYKLRSRYTASGEFKNPLRGGIDLNSELSIPNGITGMACISYEMPRITGLEQRNQKGKTEFWDEKSVDSGSLKLLKVEWLKYPRIYL
jgi:hypothetical protein